jgi:hypothetical protein
MEITIKNLKIAEFASQETLCFEATVYVNGKRSFTAHNNGHGGCNCYYPLKGGDYAPVKEAEDWAKTQSLEFSFECLDQIIDKAITVFEAEKNVKRMLKKLAIFDDGKVYIYKCKSDHPTARNQIKVKRPNAIILNDLALSEVVEIYNQVQEQGDDND